MTGRKVERKAFRVAIAIGPNLGQNTRLADEWIVLHRRAIRGDVNDPA
jgi:hypothetical protein